MQHSALQSHDSFRIEYSLASDVRDSPAVASHAFRGEVACLVGVFGSVLLPSSITLLERRLHQSALASGRYMCNCFVSHHVIVPRPLQPASPQAGVELLVDACLLLSR